MSQQQRHQLPQTAGPVDRVPCPYCGKNNDLRELQGQQILDTGSGVICDHCHRRMLVAGIRTVTVVAVTPESPANALPAPTQRRYLKR